MSRLSAAVLTLTGLLVAPLAAAQTPPPAPTAAPTTARPHAPAQTPPVPARQSRPTTPPTAPTAAPTPKPAAAPAHAMNPENLRNIRIELAISESQGSGPNTKKTVTLMTSGLTRGSVRSTLRTPGINMVLNVDALPSFVPDGRISLQLNFQYVPEHVASEQAATAELNESMSVILADGKPLVISQSADAKGDRKVTVEVTATIVK